MAQTYQPEINAGLGLIFRLNALWEKADSKGLSGNLDGWELVLDRIYSNLLYRNDIEVVEDKDGNILQVKLSQKDNKIWKKIKNNIAGTKRNMRTTKSKLEYSKLKTEWYTEIMMYDIWLRKFMNSLGLYLKETEANPSKALFGSNFGRKR